MVDATKPKAKVDGKIIFSIVTSILSISLAIFVILFGNNQCQQTSRPPVLVPLLEGVCPRPQPRTIIIGTDPTTFPYEFYESNTNQIKGFDIDLIQEVGNIIGAKIELKAKDYSLLFDGLQQNEFDAIISCVSITTERRSLFLFSTPYLELSSGDQLAIVVPLNNPNLLVEINNALDTLRTNGTLRRLQTEYNLP